MRKKMISFETGVQVSSVNVMTSDGGGHSTEQLVELAMDKIMSVSNTAPPAIRDQAEAFQNYIYTIVLYGIKNAITSDRTTMVNLLNSQGHHDMAKIIKEL